MSCGVAHSRHVTNHHKAVPPWLYTGCTVWGPATRTTRWVVACSQFAAVQQLAVQPYI